MGAVGAAVACALAAGAASGVGFAQSARLEYRVVFAPAAELGRRLDDAGREGYACLGVARPEPDAPMSGVVVVLSRPVGQVRAGVVHRVIPGGGRGSDLQLSLDRAGALGLRLCGISFDEGQGTPSPVAVMTGSAQATGAWRYAVEVLSNYRSSLPRLNAAGRDGLLPVAATPVNDNRVAALRSWMVVLERPVDGRAPSDVAVRSGSGPDALQKALVEQRDMGYHIDLSWKEGNDFVTLMTRPTGTTSAPPPVYTVEATAPSGVAALPRPYLADFPYLSDQRLLIAERAGLASNAVVEETLPTLGPLGALGGAAASAMETIADHIGRNRDYAVASLTVRRGDHGAFILRAVMTHRLP
jgi:hypothetical protein